MGILKKILKWSCIISGVILIIMFIGTMFIRFNLFPTVKTLWVTSSMTTMSHQYLAKLVATDEEIQDILDSNRVDDSVEAFNKNIVHVPKENTSKTEKTDTVSLIEVFGSSFKGYMLQVSNPKKIKLATSQDIGQKGTLLKDLIKSKNGIAGINAGGFTDDKGHGNGGIPTGIIIEDGEIKWMDKNQSSFSVVGFDSSGILTLGNFTVDEIKRLGIKQGVSFGPYLIVNGHATKIYGDGGWGVNPRTVIGQKSDGTVLLLVIDGRQPGHSIGATIKECQDMMIKYGAVNASNLDGGSSSVLYYEDKRINKPSTPAGERPLPSAFIVTK